MRAKRTSQVSIFDQFAAHGIGRELAGMSTQFDTHPVLLDLVAGDLGSSATTGRCGLTAESALRCALLKQYHQLSYEALAFHLLDSASFQAFARLPVGWTPRKAALQVNTAAITDTTWQVINTQLLAAAGDASVERATMWRIDSTVIDSLIHEPSDSGLLLDGVRVMVRLLKAGSALPGASALDWRNHSRRAKKRARAIRYTRGQDKKQGLYRELVVVTQATPGYLDDAVAVCARRGLKPVPLAGPGRPLHVFDPTGARLDSAPRVRRRARAGCGQARQPVRAAYRHHRQGSTGRALWPQAQSDQWP